MNIWFVHFSFVLNYDVTWTPIYYFRYLYSVTSSAYRELSPIILSFVCVYIMNDFRLLYSVLFSFWNVFFWILKSLVSRLRSFLILFITHKKDLLIKTFKSQIILLKILGDILLYHKRLYNLTLTRPLLGLCDYYLISLNNCQRRWRINWLIWRHSRQ